MGADLTHTEHTFYIYCMPRLRAQSAGIGVCTGGLMAASGRSDILLSIYRGNLCPNFQFFPTLGLIFEFFKVKEIIKFWVISSICN